MGDYKPVVLTAAEKYRMEVVRGGLMSEQPFYAHFMYSEMKEFYTRDIPTAATDGRTLYFNPDYMMGRSVQEGIFILAHEIDHAICRQPQRLKHYAAQGDLNGKPVDPKHFNVVADYVVNAGLVAAGVGLFNPDWLWADDVTPDDLLEDIYARKWKDRKNQPSKAGGKGARGLKPDKAAQGAGGGFDSILPPKTDPVTGQTDETSEQEHKEAVARAAAAAKAMGKLPAHLARRVEALLAPQVNWREHVRMLLTGRMGNHAETWNRPDRRRLVLNPIVIMPGRKGFGAELVVVAVDTSGSVGPNELDAFIAEIGGVLADVRPRTVMVIACDAAVHQVEYLATLDELEGVRQRGLKGGGGTSFVPVFELVEKERLRPDTLIYLTDMMGTFPTVVPTYPVVWCATSDRPAPFGDVVRLEL